MITNKFYISNKKSGGKYWNKIKCDKNVKFPLTTKTKSHIITTHPRKPHEKWGFPHRSKRMAEHLANNQMLRERGVCMTKIRSFLRSLLLFVRLLAAKAEKRVRPSSVLAVGVLAAVAAVACMNSPAGGDGNVMAAPMERQVRLETV